MKKEKGAVGCVTCGTSLGCFFPLTLLFSVVLVASLSSYFDSNYIWESADTWLVVVFAALLIFAILVGILQAAVGIWSLMGFFDQQVTEDELSLLDPIPVAESEPATEEDH